MKKIVCFAKTEGLNKDYLKMIAEPLEKAGNEVVYEKGVDAYYVYKVIDETEDD